jgi:DnaJ family protein C protein 19
MSQCSSLLRSKQQQGGAWIEKASFSALNPSCGGGGRKSETAGGGGLLHERRMFHSGSSSCCSCGSNNYGDCRNFHRPLQHGREERFAASSSSSASQGFLGSSLMRSSSGSGGSSGSNRRSTNMLMKANAREFHSSVPKQNTTLILAAVGVAVGSQVIKYSVEYVEEWQKNAKEAADAAEAEEAKNPEAKEARESAEKKKGKMDKKVNFFDQFGFGGNSKYYEGGFDDTMTRREAALILGVRESADKQRIQHAHRQILILNHPDTGGSNFIASKVNEAKELLIKGK